MVVGSFRYYISYGAWVVKSVNTEDLKSSALRLRGSSPLPGTYDVGSFRPQGGEGDGGKKGGQRKHLAAQKRAEVLFRADWENSPAREKCPGQPCSGPMKTRS
jgi:hypothetical protein